MEAYQITVNDEYTHALSSLFRVYGMPGSGLKVPGGVGFAFAAFSLCRAIAISTAADRRS